MYICPTTKCIFITSELLPCYYAIKKEIKFDFFSTCKKQTFASAAAAAAAFRVDCRQLGQDRNYTYCCYKLNFTVWLSSAVKINGTLFYNCKWNCFEKGLFLAVLINFYLPHTSDNAYTMYVSSARRLMKLNHTVNHCVIEEKIILIQ